MMAPASTCTCGESKPHIIGRRATADGRHVYLWDDGLMDRPNLSPPPPASPEIAAWSARLMVQAAPAVAALPELPPAPDPAEEYERTYGVLVDPSRWAEVEDIKVGREAA